MSSENKIDLDKITYLGYVDNLDEKIAFGIKNADRKEGVVIMGSNDGAETILLNIAVQDILSDRKVLYISDKPNLLREISKYIPEHRKDETLLLTAGSDYSFTINPFKNVSSSIWTVLYEYMGNVSDFQVDILKQAESVVRSVSNSTLVDFLSFFTDLKTRENFLKQSGKNQEWGELQVTDMALREIAVKLRRFFSLDGMRMCLDRGMNKNVFDGKSIVLADFSQLKDKSAKGFVAHLFLEMLSDISYESFIVDMPFAITSLTLEIVNKSENVMPVLHINPIDALSPDLRFNIFQSFKTKVSFNLKQEDAERVENLFSDNISVAKLTSLKERNFAIALNIDGQVNKSFTAVSFAKARKPEYDFSDYIIEASKDLHSSLSDIRLPDIKDDTPISTKEDKKVVELVDEAQERSQEELNDILHKILYDKED